MYAKKLIEQQISENDKELVHQFVRRGALYFHTTRNPVKMMDFVNMFPTQADRCKFLER